MQKGESYIMMYAAGVCLLCSVLLAGTTMALKPRQDAESELDRKRNVLKAFDAPMRDEATGEPISGPEVERLYTQHVREITVTAPESCAFSPKLSTRTSSPSTMRTRARTRSSVEGPEAWSSMPTIRSSGEVDTVVLRSRGVMRASGISISPRTA